MLGRISASMTMLPPEPQHSTPTLQNIPIDICLQNVRINSLIRGEPDKAGPRLDHSGGSQVTFYQSMRHKHRGRVQNKQPQHQH